LDISKLLQSEPWPEKLSISGLIAKNNAFERLYCRNQMRTDDRLCCKPSAKIIFRAGILRHSNLFDIDMASPKIEAVVTAITRNVRISTLSSRF